MISIVTSYSKSLTNCTKSAKPIVYRSLFLMLLYASFLSCKKSVPDVLLPPDYKGQKWIQLADSFGELKIINSTLEKRLEISLNTNAVGGSCIANGFNDAEADGNHRLSFIQRLPAAIADKSQLILLVTGGNDWNYSVPIGMSSDTTKTTYYGALNFIAQQISLANKKTIWITMIQRNTIKHGGKIIGMANYLDQKRYSEAMHHVGKKFKIQVIDAFDNSGITYENASTYTTDGAHPVTQAGIILYSNFIADEILKPYKL